MSTTPQIPTDGTETVNDNDVSSYSRVVKAKSNAEPDARVNIRRFPALILDFRSALKATLRVSMSFPTLSSTSWKSAKKKSLAYLEWASAKIRFGFSPVMKSLSTRDTAQMWTSKRSMGM